MLFLRRITSAHGERVAPAWPPSVDAFGRDVSLFRGAEDHTLEYMSCGAPDLRPLVLLHSLEFPGWPSPQLCDLAGKAGLRIVAVRRPGFGANPPLNCMDAQARLVQEFLDAEDLDGAVIVASGSANPVAHRLALSRNPRIALSVFANCGFSYEQLKEFRPEWYARVLEQTLHSRAGARLSLMALRSSWGIFGRNWVFETVFNKSPGDLAFLRENPEIMGESINTLLDRIDAPTFMLEIQASLLPDPLLADGAFEGVPAIAVSGMETTDSWKAGIGAEAARLGLPPVTYLPSGDMLVVHRSPAEFVACLGEYLS